MSDKAGSAAIIAIDTGGTFTDVVLTHETRAFVLKLPSTPEDPAAAALAGIRQILADHDLASCALVIHGSTVATNALLERKGARVALITNRGFEDVIEIARQNRPQLYALVGTRPPPLVARDARFGIGGRMDHSGHELTALSHSELNDVVGLLRDSESVAICLLHSYANGAHEIEVENALRDAGFAYVTRSCALLPEYREYERTATSVVNAYVMPMMDGYLEGLAREAGVTVRIMGSSGGALPVEQARREPVHTVLSGPAGGVSGALAAAQAVGISNIITFDMGGTSTDVSLCPGHSLQTREFTIAGLPVAVPVLDIHTVGAGGGSVAWRDAGGALRVGPRSAGARPGPICYGRGGAEVTVTDANVWLGRLPAQAFLGGQHLLDRAAIEPRLAQLAAELNMSLEAAAEGVLTVVNTTMEGALRVISVERGYDPAEFTLTAFGGAAGLHAAALAESLGIPRVLLPPQPGLLSAFGMLVAPVRKAAARTVLLRSDRTSEEDLADLFEELERAAREGVTEEGIDPGAVTAERWIDARYAGQSHELRVRAGNWIDNLHAAHEARYGYANRTAVAEAVTLRVEAYGPAPSAPRFADRRTDGPAHPAMVYAGGAWGAAQLVERDSMRDVVSGPAVITEYSATTWVPPGWRVQVLGTGALIMERK